MLGNRNGLIFVYVCVLGHMSVSLCVCLHMWYVCLEYAQLSVCLWRPKVNIKCLPQFFFVLFLFLRRSLPWTWNVFARLAANQTQDPSHSSVWGLQTHAPCHTIPGFYKRVSGIKTWIIMLVQQALAPWASSSVPDLWIFLTDLDTQSEMSWEYPKCKDKIVSCFISTLEKWPEGNAVHCFQWVSVSAVTCRLGSGMAHPVLASGWYPRLRWVLNLWGCLIFKIGFTFLTSL